MEHSLNLPQASFNALIALESRATQFFIPNCSILAALSIFKCNPGETNDDLLLLDHFYFFIQ